MENIPSRIKEQIIFSLFLLIALVYHIFIISDENPFAIECHVDKPFLFVGFRFPMLLSRINSKRMFRGTNRIPSVAVLVVR